MIERQNTECELRTSVYNAHRFYMIVCVVLTCVMIASCSSSKKSSLSGVKHKTIAVKTNSKVSSKDSRVLSKSSSSKSSSTKTQTVLQRYAKQMSVNMSSLENPKLYVLLDEWIGVPYKYAGSSKSGVDCSGLVNSIYGKFTSKPIPRSSAELAKVINPVNKNKLREGDLVFFNYDGKNNSHVGIYLQNGFFVHASSMKGVIISDLKSNYYKQRLSKGGPLRVGSLSELTGDGIP